MPLSASGAPAEAEQAAELEPVTPAASLRRSPARRLLGLLSAASGVLLILALGGLWEFVVKSGTVDTPTFPALSEVLRTFWELIRDGTFATVFGSSLKRLFIGYAIASLLAVVIGLLMGSFRSIHRLLDPVVEILRPIPSPAYIPMAILFLGIGDRMKIFIVAFSSFFPILLNTISGVRNVDPVIVNTGRTLGLRTRQIVWKIVIPSGAPYILTGMRISLAIALIVTVIAEMVAGNSGIGFFIVSNQRTFHIAEMYAGVIALAVVGFSLNKIFVAIERRLLKWNTGVAIQG
jgi:ABC-type nitrate/sulfonate/bicarbonate transport system permease component